MRKIEQMMLTAISRQQNWRRSNTEVRIMCNGTIAAVYLHENLIALYFYTTCTLRLSSAGWQTVTTKSRLNALLGWLNGEHIYQRNYVWYYSWGGEFIDEPLQSILDGRIHAMNHAAVRRDSNLFVA